MSATAPEKQGGVEGTEHGRPRGVSATRGGRPSRRSRPRAAHARIVPWALATALGAACGRGEEGREYGRPADLRVAGAFEPPGEGFLWAPVDVAIGGDRVWILDAGAGQAHAYDLDGRYRQTVGRKGQGPGELEDPLALGVAGDSLWVLNTGNGRLEYFSLTGRFLGSVPFPDTLPTPVDLVRWGGAFYGTLPFGEAPGIRFGGARPPALFGAALSQRARELAPPGGRIPSVYRLAQIDNELWLAHLYLPIVGVFDSTGRLERLLEYPAREVTPGETSYEEGSRQERWLQRAPARPAGGLGFLEVDGMTYLLTHQRSEGGRQVLVSWPEDGAPARASLGPPGLLLVSAAGAGGRSYVVGARGEGEEPAVLIVEDEGPGSDHPAGRRTHAAR